MMEIRELILELCHEAGDGSSDDEIMEEWKANHACCCLLHLYKAAEGDRLVLSNVRRCMGLRLTQ